MTPPIRSLYAVCHILAWTCAPHPGLLLPCLDPTLEVPILPTLNYPQWLPDLLCCVKIATLMVKRLKTQGMRWVKIVLLWLKNIFTPGRSTAEAVCTEWSSHSGGLHWCINRWLWKERKGENRWRIIFPEVINHSKVWKLPQWEPTLITIGFIWHQVYVCSEASLRSAGAKNRLPVRHLKIAAVLEVVQVCTVTQP